MNYNTYQFTQNVVYKVCKWQHNTQNRLHSSSYFSKEKWMDLIELEFLAKHTHTYVRLQSQQFATEFFVNGLKWRRASTQMRACVRVNILVRSFIDWLLIAHAHTKTMNPKRVAIYLFTFFVVVSVYVLAPLFFVVFFIDRYEVFYHLAVLFPYCFLFHTINHLAAYNWITYCECKRNWCGLCK